METETIDLTDPLEEVLRLTGWSPEYLQQRIVKLSEENATKVGVNIKNVNDMTLSDLMEHFNNEAGNDENSVETIELSDDDNSKTDVAEAQESELSEVTEVKVIEINDIEDDDNSEPNEEDDDEFFEESRVHIDNFCNKQTDKKVFIQESGKNLSSNTLHQNSSLPSKDVENLRESIICLSSDSSNDDFSKSSTENVLIKSTNSTKIENNKANTSEGNSSHGIREYAENETILEDKVLGHNMQLTKGNKNDNKNDQKDSSQSEKNKGDTVDDSEHDSFKKSKKKIGNENENVSSLDENNILCEINIKRDGKKSLKIDEDIQKLKECTTQIIKKSDTECHSNHTIEIENKRKIDGKPVSSNSVNNQSSLKAKSNTLDFSLAEEKQATISLENIECESVKAENSISLLLKSLDDAIETCNQSTGSSNHECDVNKGSDTSTISSNIIDIQNADKVNRQEENQSNNIHEMTNCEKESFGSLLNTDILNKPASINKPLIGSLNRIKFTKADDSEKNDKFINSNIPVVLNGSENCLTEITKEKPKVVGEDTDNLSRIEIVISNDPTSPITPVEISSLLENITEKPIQLSPKSDNVVSEHENPKIDNKNELFHKDEQNNTNKKVNCLLQSSSKNNESLSERNILKSDNIVEPLNKDDQTTRYSTENFISLEKPETITAAVSQENSLTKSNYSVENKSTHDKQGSIAIDSDDIMTEEKKQINFEDIRKSLKLQLTSLRNKKRMDILQDVKTQVVPLDTISENVSRTITPNAKLVQQFTDVTNLKIKSPDAISESVTSNVVSLERQEPEVLKPDIATEKLDEDEDVSNVLNEIRKIIRKPKGLPKISAITANHTFDSDLTSNFSKTPKRTEVQCQEDTSIVSSKIKHKTDLTSKDVQESSTVSSPFISNTLDEFLTDSKLNVSYTIPKSGAEEGLRQNYADEPIMPPVISEIKEEDGEKPLQEPKYKPKTLAEKRRLLEKHQLKEKRRMEKVKKLEDAHKRSFVLYKDRKIFVIAKSKGKCIASIDSNIFEPVKEENKNVCPRKPSLLTDLYKKATSPVKYTPGPLCKKDTLQTDNSNWTSELKILPKVKLNILPQQGKPIHPKLLHILPQWDGEVNDYQIEFALSAVVTKSKEKQRKIFQFDVPYENHQTQILARKKIMDKPDIKLHCFTRNKSSSTSDQEIAQIIEKLLDYVEIKEIAPSLIKEDTGFNAIPEIYEKNEEKPPDNHLCLKRKHRHTKTNRELLRLSCKVVSVEVEENEPETQCYKAYCTLGCVCKSLQCEKIIGLHCRKAKCIFGCTCPKEKDKILSIAEPTIRLPAGTDLLSTDTVSRIEGEAKRNLAKVEKEFTQTVIHTNDKTIVVGFGNKPRRVTRFPKKYTDFFEEENLKEESSKKEVEPIPIRECFVDMDRWDFSNVIPYCLQHHLYDCYCRGVQELSNNTSSSSVLKYEAVKLNPKKKDGFGVSAETNVESVLKKNDIKRTVEESFKEIIRKSASVDKNKSSESDFEETLYSVTGRPLRKKKKIYKADFVFDGDASTSQKVVGGELSIPVWYEPRNCSRSRGIPDRYYKKSRSFTNDALLNDFANNLTEADLLKAQIQETSSDVTEADCLKNTIIKERKRILKEIETTEHKNKRKQKIQVREDEDITIKATSKAVPVSSKNLLKNKIKSVFKGEIIVNNSEWLKKIDKSTQQPLGSYARILPWTALLNGFISKAINVYCISDMPLRLLLNVGTKLASTKVMDIEVFGHKILETPLKAKASWLLRQSEDVRDIIKWLLSSTLPSKYKSNTLSFLLVETLPDRFEVRGLCTQGEKSADGSPKPESTEEIFDQIAEVKHKNMDNEVQTLFISKAKYRLRELVEEGCDDDMTDNLYMWVGLPEVYKIGKWRVVFLKNDFAYLYFKNVKYSIKYTDLVKLTEMAKKETVTLILKNLQIRRSYSFALFGLYISHNYSDRIFIGPYFSDYDEDDIETLRYINESLVSSESFNKMTGNSNYRCGHWMYERVYHHTPTVFIKSTIDLTSDRVLLKSSDSAVKSQPQVLPNTAVLPTKTIPSTSELTASIPTTSVKDEHTIYHNGLPIYIKSSKPRSPSEFNRFIITNIPHFGYLGAYQPENSSALEVSWPFEKKVLQFQNADNARDFLQERFNQLLQPVPESFKIQVIVLIQLDLKEHKPINSDFLSGHCICGYFGTYNFKEVTDEFCKEKLKISKEEITKLFAKRAHEYIRKKIEELAGVVGIVQKDTTNYTVKNILVKSREDIKALEHRRRQQVTEIQALELQVVAKIKKLYKLVKILPMKERNIESKIIKEILQIRPKRLGSNDVVEIRDDDKEGDVAPQKVDPIVYCVESDDDTSASKKTIRKSLKRKIGKTKIRIGKAAKVTPSVISTPKLPPSTTISIIDSNKDNSFSTWNVHPKGDQSNDLEIITIEDLETNTELDESHYVIDLNEANIHDTNLTEIIVSKSDTTSDNIDFSTVTVIASVPSTTCMEDDNNKIAASLDTTTSYTSLDNFFTPLKTYSKKTESAKDIRLSVLSSEKEATEDASQKSFTTVTIQNNQIVDTNGIDSLSPT